MTVARTGLRVTGAEVVGVLTAEAMTEVAVAAHPPVWGKSAHPRRYHHTLLKINYAHRPELFLLWITQIFSYTSRGLSFFFFFLYNII